MKLKFARHGYEKTRYFGLEYGVAYEVCTVNVNGDVSSLMDHNNYNTQVYVYPEWCKEPPYVVEIPEDLFQL